MCRDKSLRQILVSNWDGVCHQKFAVRTSKTPWSKNLLFSTTRAVKKLYNLSTTRALQLVVFYNEGAGVVREWREMAGAFGNVHEDKRGNGVDRHRHGLGQNTKSSFQLIGRLKDLYTLYTPL